MESVIRKYKAVVDDGFDLSAEFNVVVESRKNVYLKYLNKDFKGCKRKNFVDVIDILLVNSLKEGSLYYKQSATGKQNIFISKENNSNVFGHKCFVIKDYEISPTYLLWFLSRKKVIEYLKCFTIGAIVSYIPDKAFRILEIPYPKQGLKYDTLKNINIGNGETSFRDLVKDYYQQYLLNYQEKNYLTASILAGAISEALLYGYMLDAGIASTLLERKMLGSLIDLAKVYLHGKEIDDFPISQIVEIQKMRNKAVHPFSSSGDKEKNITLEDTSFVPFDTVIKYFGL